MSWTDERIAELTRLWQAGHSASEIGKRLGVSKNSVVGKAHRLKLPSRPSPIKQNRPAGAATAGPQQPGAQNAGASSGAPAAANGAGTTDAPAAETHSGAPARARKAGANGSAQANGGAQAHRTAARAAPANGSAANGTADDSPAARPAGKAERAAAAKEAANTGNGAARAAGSTATLHPAETGSARPAARGGHGPSGGKGGADAGYRGLAQQRASIEARTTTTGCLWPIGDPGDADFHFCGAETVPGKPYCAEHAARAYITRSRSERGEEAA